MDAAVKVVALAVALQLSSRSTFSLEDVDVSGIEVCPSLLASLANNMYWCL